jgi:succinate-semialdehyde dehydrogenase/glutarate-semialdehyde dehydrogenase
MTATWPLPPSDLENIMNVNQHSSHPDHDPFGLSAFSHGLYIGGAWRPAAGESRIEVIDPSTEAVIAAVPDATLADAVAAVEAAASAAEGWREMPPRKRSEILRRCFELMVERSEMLAGLISLENGKALRDARGEVAYAA